MSWPSAFEELLFPTGALLAVALLAWGAWLSANAGLRDQRPTVPGARSAGRPEPRE